MVLGWLLLLVIALSPGTTGTKICIYCDLTDTADCPGITMNCGQDEDCYTGRGSSPGLSDITNKGCVASSACGREEPVTYQGVTYTLTSKCCFGQMCNRAPYPEGRRSVGTMGGLALGVLLLHWL